MWILRYLKSSLGKGISFSKSDDHRKIETYTDVDCAGSLYDRRSTSRYFTFVGGNLVTWRSKKQNIVASSSAEVEYRGMALGICEMLWLRQLLQDLGYPSRQPIRLYCDNKVACDIAHNPVQHDRTKHKEVDRFFYQGEIRYKDYRIAQDSIRRSAGWCPHQSSIKSVIFKVCRQVGHVWHLCTNLRGSVEILY